MMLSDHFVVPGHKSKQYDQGIKMWVSKKLIEIWEQHLPSTVIDKEMVESISSRIFLMVSTNI